MGAECSCTQEKAAAIDSKDEVVAKAKPKIVFSSPRKGAQYLVVTSDPINKSFGDSEMIVEDPSPELEFLTHPPEAQSPKDWLKMPSFEIEQGLKPIQMIVHQTNTIKSHFHANPIDFQHGDVWKLENIRLNSLIQKSPGKYLWEASNTVTGKKCGVKINYIDTSKLLHNNLSKTESILKEIISIHDPNVIDMYSFSIWESEVRHKPCLIVVLVQEFIKCSLRDVHSIKVENRTLWPQNEILTILHNIYSGLAVCKERHIVHGKLLLENILIPETVDRVVIADFNIKIPIAGEAKTAPSTPNKSSFAKFVNGPGLVSEDALKILSTPDEKDIYDLTHLILKLITHDENVGGSYDALRKDEKYRRTYQKVFEALDLISNRKATPSQILQDISWLIGKSVGAFNLGLPVNFDIRIQEESRVEALFTKIDCYEMLKQYETASEVYSELKKILESKDRKGVTEYQEYIKCVNRTIKHYLSSKDYLKARDVSNELSTLIKTDETLKKTLKSYPKEYINFIFLLGNISEGLNDPEKAIVLYTKGLSYCFHKNISIESYSSALKKISNLYLEKKEDHLAFEHLKKLGSFYESQEGYYSDKADTYLKMANIVTEEGNFGLGVKFYLKSLDNLKKGKLSNNEERINVLKKIIGNYKKLNEDENALTYLVESLEFKRVVYGNESQECLEDLKEVGELHIKLKNYHEALSYYLMYHKAFADNKITEEQYCESLIKLGEIYIELQKYQRARNYFMIYAEMKEKAIGIDSKEYLSAQDKIATTLFREGNYSEALSIQLKSLEIKKTMFEMDDLYLVISLSNIGDTYFAENDCEKALEYHQESLRRLEHKKEELQGEYSQLLLKIAFDFEKSGNNGQALKLVYQSFQINNNNDMEVDMEKTIEMYEILSKAKETRPQSLDFSKLTTQFE